MTDTCFVCIIVRPVILFLTESLLQLSQ